MEGNEHHKRQCPSPLPYQNPVHSRYSLPSCPPSTSSILLKDVSNFKTPIRSSNNKDQLFNNNNNNFISPSPQFFTASKLTPRPPSSTRPVTRSTRRTTAARRRLKTIEQEQAQSAWKKQVKKEQSLKSLAKSLTTWLNFLLQNPKSCGCKSSILDSDESVASSTGLGKRENGGIGGGDTWRWPKRQRDVTWRSGEEDAAFVGSRKKYSLLSDSLKEICSFDDLKERMVGYLSLSGCREVFNVMARVVKVSPAPLMGFDFSISLAPD